MSEQKYYVGLVCPTDDEVVTSYLWEDGYFYPCFNKPSYPVTLGALESLSNERLSRFVGYDDQTEIKLVGKIVEDYWINPLIELVPVEDGE